MVLDRPSNLLLADAEAHFGPGNHAHTLHFEDDIDQIIAASTTPWKVFTARLPIFIDDRLDASIKGGGCGSVKVDIALRLVHDAETGLAARPKRPALVTDPDGDRRATPSQVDGIATHPSRGWLCVPSIPSHLRPRLAPTPHPGGSDVHLADLWYFFDRLTRRLADQSRNEALDWGQLDFDSPEAQFIIDPATGDGLYLIAASQPSAV